MHGLVEAVGGQIVEQQDGGAVLGEVVLQRQNLPAIAQRALGQQADLRKAVDHHPPRLDGLHLIEDHPGGLTQLQIGGIEQALLLLLVEQALGRDQFADLDPVQVPAVGLRRAAQLGLGLGQGDVEAFLAERRAVEQEAHRRGRLTGARTSLQEVDAVALQASHQDIV